MRRFFVTTPIYYVNARPHVGHAYTTFAADALARWHRMRGEEVFFLVGTDENAQKNSEAAARELGKPHERVMRADVQAYVDRMSATWQQTWDTLGITYDRFIRTTEPQHITGVNAFINAVRDHGDIYPGTYKGWYCVDCEAFLPEKELDGGMCPMHHRVVDRIEEQNYFFRLSKYRDALLQHIEQHPHFVQPEARRNEIVAYIRDHLEDISISRPMRQWGIPFPGDPTQAVYVWFDALVNYLTGVRYGDAWRHCESANGSPLVSEQGEVEGVRALARKQSHTSHNIATGEIATSRSGFGGLDDSTSPLPPRPAESKAVCFPYGLGSRNDGKGLWPAQLHLVGKDILKFHCALWPAMLMSAGLPLPERVFAHGFFTIDGEKMSKSRGNVVDPVVMAERYGLDALRCFLFREITFGGDGDFSEARLRERYVSDLQHGIGNLAARTLTMLQKYTDGRIPAAGPEPLVRNEWNRYAGAMEGLALHDALAVAMDVVRQGDHYVEAQKPWALVKDSAQTEHLRVALGNTTEILRHAALMFAPFAPTTADRICTALGQPDWRSRPLTYLQQWGTLEEGTKVGELPHLFPALT